MVFPKLKQLVTAFALAIHCGLAPAGEITVSAASSLTNAFRDIAHGYEAQYAGSKVALNFGASGALLQQLARGAPVDVIATADQETMDQAGRQGLVVAADRQDFARNTLVLVVPADGKTLILRLEDLGLPGVERVAFGNPASVPAGRYAQRALAAAGMWPVVASKAIPTENVRQALDYVARGEVDAGFVYATDAMILHDTVRVALTAPVDSDISYPIASVAGSANADEARHFIAYVLSPAGQAILRQYGFQPPQPADR